MQQQREIEDLKRRVTALEKIVTTQAEMLLTMTDKKPGTLTLPEKRKLG